MILPDWMAGFYTLLVEKKKAPTLFAKWAAAFAVGAAVQRRVYAYSLGDQVFPNLYVFLCGPPGVGKGKVIVPTGRMLAQVPYQYLAPASVTSAALADEFEEAHRAIIGKDGVGYQYNSITILSRELSVFLPAYETTTHAMLTDIYDNEGYSERRRFGNRKGRLEIPHAQLSLMAGTTPAYLTGMLPEGAWSEGFMSRVIMVYEGIQPVQPIVEHLEKEDEALIEALMADLREIGERDGALTWDTKALAMFNKWYTSGGKPVPSHPRLLTYLTRRHYNLMKLTEIFCLSRGGETMSVDDFELALDMLLETEVRMPDAFKAMKKGGDQTAIQEAFHFMMQKYLKNGQAPIRREMLVNFLADRVASHSVPRIVEVMIEGGMLKRVDVNKVGICFIPVRPADD